MFGNLDIKLGAEKRTHKVPTTFDALDSYAEVVAATENLERTSLQFEMLNKTAENMEHGQVLASAVADATGDNATAVAVGRESLRMSLSMIGQAHLADEAYVGAESVTAGAEGAKDFFKAVWDKIKETALKVWKWIKDLVAKVVRFVMGVFGKAEDTAEQLTAMLKKLKADGKTRLNETEFPKEVRLRLAKEMPLLVVNTKTLTAQEIEEWVDKAANLNTDKKVSEKNDYLEPDKVKDIITKLSVKDNAGSYVDVSATADEVAVNITDEAYSDIADAIKKLVGNDDVKPTISDGTPIKNVDVQDAIDNDASDIERGKAFSVAVTPENVKVVVVGLTEDANDAYKNFTSSPAKDVDGEEISTDAGKYTRTLNKIISGIKVVNVNVKVEDISDATDNEEGITPLDHSECTSIAKKLKDAGKDMEKAIKALDKEVSKGEKEAPKIYKTMSDVVDQIGKGNNDTKGLSERKKVAKALTNACEKLLKANLDVAKSISVGLAESAKETVRSRFSHIIKASADLYVKK